jgi:hypothetical protein
VGQRLFKGEGMETVLPADEDVHLAADGATANDRQLTHDVTIPTPSALQPKRIEQPDARAGVTLYTTMIAVVAALAAFCLASTQE